MFTNSNSRARARATGPTLKHHEQAMHLLSQYTLASACCLVLDGKPISAQSPVSLTFLAWLPSQLYARLVRIAPHNRSRGLEVIAPTLKSRELLSQPRRYRIHRLHRYALFLPEQRCPISSEFVTLSPYCCYRSFLETRPNYSRTRFPHNQASSPNIPYVPTSYDLRHTRAAFTPYPLALSTPQGPEHETFYDVDRLHSTASALGPIHRLNLKRYPTA